MASINAAKELKTTSKGKPVKAYQVRWRDASGKRHSKTFRLLDDARRFKSDIEVDSSRGGAVDPKRGKETFGRYLEAVLDQTGREASTLAGYRSWADNWVLPELGSEALLAIRRHHIEAALSRMADDGAGESTLEHCLRLIHLVLQDAVNKEILTVNRASSVSVSHVPTKPVRFLSPEELDALAEAVPAKFRGLILTLGYTGLRIGEAAALRVGRVDTMRSTLHIIESATEVGGKIIWGPTKGKRNRTVHMTPTLRDELVAHLAEYSDPSDPQALVFPAPNGGVIRRTLFRQRILRPGAERAGIQPLPTTHHLRHTAAAIALMAGWHTLQVAEMLGHSDPTVTQRIYEHLIPQLHAEGLDRLDALMRGSRSSEIP